MSNSENIEDRDVDETAHTGGNGDGEAALARIFAADGPGDLDEYDDLSQPLYWPGIPAADIADAFEELRNWVDGLFERYEHLDHRAVPPCWWRHPGHIEALQALRDHERGSFAESSPAQAGTSWQREFQFIEARLREWTAFYGCDQSSHKLRSRKARLVDEDEWSEMIKSEQTRRRQPAAPPDQPR